MAGALFPPVFLVSLRKYFSLLHMFNFSPAMSKIRPVKCRRVSARVAGALFPPVFLQKNVLKKNCETKINNHTFCDNNYSTVVTWQQRLLPIHFFELTQETFIPNTYTNIRQYFNASYHLHHITVKISNRTVSTSHKRMRIRIRT